MKKTVLILAALIMSFGAFAQDPTVWWSFDFEDGLRSQEGLTSLTLNLNGAAGSEVSTESVKNGDYSLKFITKDAANTNVWNSQIQFPEFPIIAGDTYRLTFWARTDTQEGDGNVARFSTAEGAMIGPPAGGTGVTPDQYWADFFITSDWKEFTDFSYNKDGGVLITYEKEVAKFNLDLGGVNNATYFFDDFRLINLEGSPLPGNAIKDVKLTAKDIAFGVEGGIVVKGQQAEVYSVDGRLVKQATYGFNALKSGIYVVKSQGVAAKFVVR